MKRLLKRRLFKKEGQTATEYMLIIAVVVFAIVVAAKIFLGKFEGGMKDMGAAISDVFKSSANKLKGAR